MSASVSRVEDFLKSFHERFPGCTSSVMQHGKTAEGETSYDALASLVKGPGRVLDLACGDGFLLSRLRGGNELIGVDMSEGELELARKRGGAQFLLGNGRELPLANASVNYVLCHMAFMLMMNIEGVVAEIRRVLAPGGTFGAVISLPSTPIDPVRASFLRARDKALQAEGLEPSHWIGESRARDEEGLRQLFAGWADLDFQNLELRYELTLEEAVEYFTLLYSPGQLSEAGLRAYSEHLKIDFRNFLEQDRIHLRDPLLLFSCRKPA